MAELSDEQQLRAFRLLARQPHGSADQSHGVLPELASWILNRLLFTIEINGQSMLTFDAGI
jgi:hypothetical protein